MLRPPKAAHGWVEVTLAKFQAAWSAALGGLLRFLAAVNERYCAGAAWVVLIFDRNVDLLEFLS